jgi:hypothetical protein
MHPRREDEDPTGRGARLAESVPSGKNEAAAVVYFRSMETGRSRSRPSYEAFVRPSRKSGLYPGRKAESFDLWGLAPCEKPAQVHFPVAWW